MKDEFGFQKKKGRHLLLLNNEFYATIGLGTTSYLEICPVIGVGSVQVANIVEEIYGKEFKKKNPYMATVTSPIGYLTDYPSYRPLTFLDIFIDHTNDDSLKMLCETEFNRFRHEYSVFGKKFIEKNSSLDGMKESFEQNMNLLYQERRLPIVYFLLGMHDKAMDFLNEEMKRREDEKSYIEYAAKLIAYINHSPVKETGIESISAQKQTMMLVASKKMILDALSHYNEIEIHNRLLDMTEEQKEKIEELTKKYLFKVSPIPKAVVMACIELVEGKPRTISIFRKNGDKEKKASAHSSEVKS